MLYICTVILIAPLLLEYNCPRKQFYAMLYLHYGLFYLVFPALNIGIAVTMTTPTHTATPGRIGISLPLVWRSCSFFNS